MIFKYIFIYVIKYLFYFSIALELTFLLKNPLIWEKGTRQAPSEKQN